MNICICLTKDGWKHHVGWPERVAGKMGRGRGDSHERRKRKKELGGKESRETLSLTCLSLFLSFLIFFNSEYTRVAILIFFN